MCHCTPHVHPVSRYITAITEFYQAFLASCAKLSTQWFMEYEDLKPGGLIATLCCAVCELCCLVMNTKKPNIIGVMLSLSHFRITVMCMQLFRVLHVVSFRVAPKCHAFL